ncbi:MAG: hypothetical protein IJO89_03800 [Clostridia bacterium]|nr:hypothetical protein [Clostridia bacterium]
MEKYKTKQCHNCGYAIMQKSKLWNGKPDNKDPNLLLEKCPFCKSDFYFGEDIEFGAGCLTILENKVYAQYIMGNPEKEKLYQARLQKELEEFENEMKVQEDQVEQNAKQQNKEENLPKCPICGSTNLKKLTALNRGMSTLMWGLGSNKIGKTWECQNCKSTF